MNLIVHTLEDFPTLPWDILDPEECGKNWSFCRGGYGFSDSTVSLQVFTKNTVDVYPFPEALSEIIKINGRLEVESLQKQICILLGV